MIQKLTLVFLLITSFVCTETQASENENGSWGELKGGIRIQKTQKLYWENGFALDYASEKIADSRIHFGMSYATSRLGSAMGSNAMKQDNILVNVGYYFRHQKRLQPFTRLNTGYFSAEHEFALFDVLPDKAFLFSIDAGLSYAFKIPVTLRLSAGYNLNTGTGSAGPGTLYPVYYQMSMYYTLF